MVAMTHMEEKVKVKLKPGRKFNMLVEHHENMKPVYKMMTHNDGFFEVSKNQSEKFADVFMTEMDVENAQAAQHAAKALREQTLEVQAQTARADEAEAEKQKMAAELEELQAGNGSTDGDPKPVAETAPVDPKPAPPVPIAGQPTKPAAPPAKDD